MPYLASVPRPLSRPMLAMACSLLLGACSGGGDAAGAAAPSHDAAANPAADATQVDAALEENPCALAPADMVATLFEVPAAELQRETSMSSACAYSWESDDGSRRLDAAVHVVDVFEDAEAAALRFRSATRGMTGTELDRAMDEVKAEASSDLRRGGRKAADAIMDGSTGSAGIQFEDVAGVGDEARMALTVGAGDLHVLVGNLYFTASAYSGAAMPMPAELKPAAILAADSEWRRDTMPQRKDAATGLARAVVDQL